MEKGRTLIGLSLGMLGYMFSLEGAWLPVSIAVLLFMAVLALLLMIKDYLPRRGGRAIDAISADLDVSWVALGLGLAGAGIKCMQNAGGSSALVILGAAFIVVSGLCIGKSIGLGGREVIRTNAKVGIVVGILSLVIGIAVCVATWDSIVTKPLANVPLVLVFMGIGVIFIWKGWRKVSLSNQKAG